MNAETIYHIALVMHITGLAMVAGTTVFDYTIVKQFWRQLAIDRQRGLAIIEATSKLPALFGIGFLLIIISGVYMMAATNGAFGEQIWFRIKFALVIVIILNGLAVGRRQGLKLRKMLPDKPQDDEAEKLSVIKRNINLFHVSQLLFFIIIFVLSVFKFN